MAAKNKSNEIRISRLYDAPVKAVWTVVFSENKGKTRMEMSMTLPTPEAAEEARKFIKKADGYSTSDIKPGGNTFYYMTNDTGVKMYGD